MNLGAGGTLAATCERGEMRKSVMLVGALLGLGLSLPAWATWKYSAEKDVSGKESLYATTLSTRKVDLGVNYRMVDGVLTLRRHAKLGYDVIFSVTAGQIVCRSYTPCQVIVRFDDHPTQVYTAIGTSNVSATTIAIKGFERFVGAARNAKKVTIEAEFYQRGNQSFSFDIAGLDVGKIQWGSKPKTVQPPDEKRQTVTPEERSPVALAREKKCLSCHEIGFKLVGPAYRDVAEKYRGTPGMAEKLASKIVAGGSGVWGEVAMPPNPISAEDAHFLAAWVLSQ